MWGLIAAALFATPRYYDAAYETSRGQRCMGAFYGGKGNSLAAAIVFILLDAAWVAVPVLGLFAVMKQKLRVQQNFRLYLFCEAEGCPCDQLLEPTDLAKTRVRKTQVPSVNLHGSVVSKGFFRVGSRSGTGTW